VARRQLLRESAGAGGGLAENWTVESTSTYNEALPADSPGLWGEAADLAALDRTFVSTGLGVAFIGMLLTFVNKPDRSFTGAQIKVSVTYSPSEEPHLELWTKLGATWTRRRRISLTSNVRSGDTLVIALDLDNELFAADSAIPDAVWITIDTAAGPTLTWIACHLFGDCALNPVPPDCPPGTPAALCEPLDCTVDPTNWLCVDIPDPDCVPTPFDDCLGGDPGDNDADPPTDPIVFPPIIVEVPMATTYSSTAGVYSHVCPGPAALRMYFGDLPGGGSVVVTHVPSGGVAFAEGLQQTITAPGVLDWTVIGGFGAGDPAIGAGRAGGYIPPVEVVATQSFAFVRQLAASELETFGNLLDILTYWWTTVVLYEEFCLIPSVIPSAGPAGGPVGGAPPVGPAVDPYDETPTVLPPALPAGPQDDDTTAPAAGYQRVFDRWFIYVDTAANLKLAKAAEHRRRNPGGVALSPPYPLMGQTLDDAVLLRAAFANMSQYINESVYDPEQSSDSVFNKKAFLLQFNGLAETHVTAIRAFAVPVERVFSLADSNPWGTSFKALPYNSTLDSQSIPCPSEAVIGHAHYTADASQHGMRINSDFNIVQQNTKYGGTAIQPGAYHLVRGVEEDPGFDALLLYLYPVPGNPLAMNWDNAAFFGRCWQPLKAGFAYLITCRVYEPIAFPVGGVVTMENTTGANPGLSSAPYAAGHATELDGRWP